jgi:hypothetical protein
MAIKLHLTVMPPLFLIIGVFGIIIILILVTNTFSITQKPNCNTPFTDNANKSELNIKHK